MSDNKFAQLVHLSIAYRQRSSAFNVCGELQLQHASISVSVLNLRNLKLLYVKYIKMLQLVEVFIATY